MNNDMQHKFEQYRNAKIELRLIDHEMHRYHTVTDTVKGSLTEFPYTACSIQIQGVDASIRLQTMDLLAAKTKQLAKLRLDVELCLNGIEDCLVASILRLRYIEGLSWQAVAMRMGSGISVSGVKMAAKRYFAGL